MGWGTELLWCVGCELHYVALNVDNKNARLQVPLRALYEMVHGQARAQQSPVVFTPSTSGVHVSNDCSCNLLPDGFGVWLVKAES